MKLPTSLSKQCSHCTALPHHQLESATHLGVVQLAGLGKLALAADGRADAAQVRQRARVRQPVQHLHADLGFWGLHPDKRADAAQARQRARVCQPVQHLRAQRRSILSADCLEADRCHPCTAGRYMRPVKVFARECDAYHGRNMQMRLCIPKFSSVAMYSQQGTL